MKNSFNKQLIPLSLVDLLLLAMNMVCSFFRFYVISASIFFAVNLDDCWQVSRDAQGNIQADPQAFPSGIPALADYIHSKKLKFGVYSGNIAIQFY